MIDDILVSSDEEYGDSSSEDERPSLLELPDTLTYRFPKEIMVFEDVDDNAVHHGQRQLQIYIKQCSDKLCAFASYGTTRMCCLIHTPVNEADIEDFVAGVSVKVNGAPYVSETSLRDLIQYIIPSNVLERTFLAVRFAVYSDGGAIVPIALMTAMFALSASAIQVKGIVTAVTVLCEPDGNLTIDPTKDLEQKCRDRIPGYAYVTAMKIMKDDHVRWYDMEGLPKAMHLKAAFNKAAEAASLQYPLMAKMVQQLAERGKNIEGSLG
uniref:Exoribonuclease phosphorolytic domain-containing protein n=1 Tax=Panagrolaimus sp. PS1159 TaxID=55785 RepID=A0AC35GY20_9BILA